MVMLTGEAYRERKWGNFQRFEARSKIGSSQGNISGRHRYLTISSTAFIDSLQLGS